MYIIYIHAYIHTYIQTYALHSCRRAYILSSCIRTYIMQEVARITGGEDEYKGSNVFLKGTQSANPHNDYSQHFIDTGQRAQNFIRDVGE